MSDKIIGEFLFFVGVACLTALTSFLCAVLFGYIATPHSVHASVYIFLLGAICLLVSNTLKHD
jgi:hypothetical protein